MILMPGENGSINLKQLIGEVAAPRNGSQTAALKNGSEGSMPRRSDPRSRIQRIGFVASLLARSIGMVVLLWQLRPALPGSAPAFRRRRSHPFTRCLLCSQSFCCKSRPLNPSVTRSSSRWHTRQEQRLIESNSRSSTLSSSRHERSRCVSLNFNSWLKKVDRRFRRAPDWER